MQQRVKKHLDSSEKKELNQSAVAWHLLENHRDLRRVSIRSMHREKKSARLNKLE